MSVVPDDPRSKKICDYICDNYIDETSKFNPKMWASSSIVRRGARAKGNKYKNTVLRILKKTIQHSKVRIISQYFSIFLIFVFQLVLQTWVVLKLKIFD